MVTVHNMNNITFYFDFSLSLKKKLHSIVNEQCKDKTLQ